MQGMSRVLHVRLPNGLLGCRIFYSVTEQFMRFPNGLFSVSYATRVVDNFACAEGFIRSPINSSSFGHRMVYSASGVLGYLTVYSVTAHFFRLPQNVFGFIRSLFGYEIIFHSYTSIPAT